MQKALFEMARKPWGIAKNRGKSKGPFFPVWVDKRDDNAMVPIINEPSDLIVLVAGGAGGKMHVVPDRGRPESGRQQAHRAGSMSGAVGLDGSPRDDEGAHGFRRGLAGR